MKKTISIVMMISNQYTERLCFHFCFFFVKNGNGKRGDIDFYSIKINNVISLFAQKMHFYVKGINNLLSLLSC